MAYRPTDKTQARKAAVRKTFLNAALGLVAQGGFQALTVAAAAQQAGMATGAVYKHFESKAHLCAELFRMATEKEVAVVQAAALGSGTSAERLLAAIDVFALRALRGQRLAYALIAEPVDALVDIERLRYRHAYAEIFERLIATGVRTGEFPPQLASVSAAAVVGVISESLVGPLSWPRDAPPPVEQARLVRAIQAFCLRAVAMKDISA